jgi:hypothetical protein
MKKRPKILICGDAGAVGPELIRRQDINILWAMSSKEAQAVLWRHRPEVCLMEEEFANSILATAPDTDGTVYLILEKTDYPRTLQAIDQAAYVPAADGGTILGAIAKASGLKFSQEPRIKVGVDVEVNCGEFTETLQTVDVSLSGICVRGFPAQDTGEFASIKFTDFESEQMVPAQLMRCFGTAEEQLAAFRFDDLDDETNQYIHELIEENLEEQDEPEAVNSRALMKKKMFTASDEEFVSDEEKEQLFSVLDGEEEISDECPEWIRELAASLTATERTVAQGESGPAWVENSLNLRAAFSKLEPTQKVPRSLKKQVLSFCRSLTARGSEYSDEVMVDVTAVRGALLGQIYRDQASRIGAVPESELATG